MKIHSAMLLSDWILWGLFLGVLFAVFFIRNRPYLREPWRQVGQKRLGMAALVVFIFYVAIGLLDSIHLQITETQANGQMTQQVVSVFDMLISPLGKNEEATYSAPFSLHLYNKSLMTLANGKEVQDYPPLLHAGKNLKNPEDRDLDILKRSFTGFLIGLSSFIVIASTVIFYLARKNKIAFKAMFAQIIKGDTVFAIREVLLTFGIVWIFIWVAAALAANYHILGTNQVGHDVFFESLKSIRTGLIIGTLTTLFMLPFALILGTMAGYFRGWIDDIVQYLYTTLSSIPGVLLISASILVLQVYIANHPQSFPTLEQQADARLLALCLILGVTSWANLCRLLRAETFKLRELEFVQAAKTLGVKNYKIIFRHIMPNVMHIILITMVLDFSGLVLAEAILSYVGVGVDPTTYSWGNIINSSRLELAREPMVWWPLLSSLIFMFFLVLSANIFSDAVRDAFDPKLRKLEERNA